jgi:YegS/Rv2252/BmrU family lipid kinase
LGIPAEVCYDPQQTHPGDRVLTIAATGRQVWSGDSMHTIDYVDPEARHVLVLRNPTAGARADQSRVDHLCRQLDAAGLVVTRVAHASELAEILAELPASAVRAVVAAGGDGTASAVANGTPVATPLTVLPLGTENLLARYLQYPFSIEALTQTILHGATVALDAGQANGRLFLLMASCGFDADVVRRLHGQRRGNIRHLTYVKPILDSIRSYSYPAVRVSCPPDPVTYVARWVFIINLPQYAGGLQLVPEAVGSDGQLNLCLFQQGSFLRGLSYLLAVLQGRHRRSSEVVHQPVRRIHLDADAEVPFQLDGDPGGVLPLDVTVVPGRLRLLVSQAWAVGHGFRHHACRGGDGAATQGMAAGTKEKAGP